MVEHIPHEWFDESNLTIDAPGHSHEPGHSILEPLALPTQDAMGPILLRKACSRPRPGFSEMPPNHPRGSVF